MEQLELPAIGEGRLRESLLWILQYECDGVRLITKERDYKVRADWLLNIFGDCKLEDLAGRAGYEKMRRVAAEELARETGMKRVSLKKRFQFLLRALNVAASRELMDRSRIPDMPHLANDGVSKNAHHTYPQYLAFRHVLPTPRHRIYAGVPRISPHSFRHSRMTYLDSIGVHPEDARFAVGASSVKVIRDHYQHPSAGTLRRLIPSAPPSSTAGPPLPTDEDPRRPLGTA